MIIITNRNKQKYLASKDIYPIENSSDCYENTEELRRAIEEYNIFLCGFTRMHF